MPVYTVKWTSKEQCEVIRIILTGTHRQMMKIQDAGWLDNWIDTNKLWLGNIFGQEIIMSLVLHMDENTPYLHATIGSIVTAERKRRERESEKMYNTQSDPRLLADDVTKRYMLKNYQDTYVAAMSPLGLQRGITGSTARHVSDFDYYKRELLQYKDNIARLQTDIEKAKEGKKTILGWCGKGNLAETKKELASKDGEQAKLQEKIAKFEAEKAALKQKCITELDRKANTERYRLSLGAKLVDYRILGNNPYTHTPEIETRVGDIMYSPVTYFTTNNCTLKAFADGELTEYEFISVLFESAKQINEKQVALFGAALEFDMGGSAQAIGTDIGGSTSTSPWEEKEKDYKNRGYVKKCR